MADSRPTAPPSSDGATFQMPPRGDSAPEAGASSHPMADPASIGQIIDGKYRVERVLGSSGMGVVYLATHLEIDQPVAIKFLLQGAQDPSALARFKREARAMGKVRSEHAVRVIDVGQLDASTPFIVMEYLEGRDLSGLMKEMKQATLPFTAEVILQACEALAVAHAAGVIHRDLKPSNIFLTAQADGAPYVKVIDFGIAKLRGSELDKADHITQSSSLVGSPRYMAPEQISGDAAALDQRVDVWALGIMLQEMLTGQRVFRAEGVGPLLVAISTQPPADIRQQWPDVPEPIVALLHRTLQKNPAHRTQDVSAFADVLAPYAPSGQARAMRIRGALMSVPPRLPSGSLSSGRLPSSAASETSSPSGVLPAMASSVYVKNERSKTPIIAIVATAVVLLGIAGAAVGLYVQRVRVSSARSSPTSVGTVANGAAGVPAGPPPAAVDVGGAPPSATASARAPDTTGASASGSSTAQPNPAPDAPALATTAGRKAAPTVGGKTIKTAPHAPAAPPPPPPPNGSTAPKPRPDLFDDPK